MDGLTLQECLGQQDGIELIPLRGDRRGCIDQGHVVLKCRQLRHDVEDRLLRAPIDVGGQPCREQVCRSCPGAKRRARPRVGDGDGLRYPG